jgi:Flp pilus assembly protein TadD
MWNPAPAPNVTARSPKATLARRWPGHSASRNQRTIPRTEARRLSSRRFRRILYRLRARRQVLPQAASADAHLAYAIALAAHGDATQSERHLREAIKYAPNHFEAHLRLGQALRDRGDAAGGTPHLRKAAESPDPHIRDAANKLYMEYLQNAK